MPTPVKPFVLPLSLIDASEVCRYPSAGDTVKDTGLWFPFLQPCTSASHHMPNTLDLGFPFAVVLSPCTDATGTHRDETLINSFDHFIWERDAKNETGGKFSKKEMAITKSFFKNLTKASHSYYQRIDHTTCVPAPSRRSDNTPGTWKVMVVIGWHWWCFSMSVMHLNHELT